MRPRNQIFFNVLLLIFVAGKVFADDDLQDGIKSVGDDDDLQGGNKSRNGTVQKRVKRCKKRHFFNNFK